MRGARGAFALTVGLFATVLTINVGVSGAAVEDSTPKLQVRAIDNRADRLSVDYAYLGDEGATDAKLNVNGSETSGNAIPLVEAGLPSAVAVVLDNSIGVSNATVQLA